MESNRNKTIHQFQNCLLFWVVGCSLMLSRSDPHLESGLSLCLAYPACQLSGHCGYQVNSHGYCSTCVQVTLILLSRGPKGKHGGAGTPYSVWFILFTVPNIKIELSHRQVCIGIHRARYYPQFEAFTWGVLVRTPHQTMGDYCGKSSSIYFHEFKPVSFWPKLIKTKWLFIFLSLSPTNHKCASRIKS